MVLHPSRRLRSQAVTGTKHDRHSTAVKVGSGHANGSFNAILRHTPSWSGVAPKAEHEALAGPIDVPGLHVRFEMSQGQDRAGLRHAVAGENVDAQLPRLPSERLRQRSAADDHLPTGELEPFCPRA